MWLSVISTCSLVNDHVWLCNRLTEWLNKTYTLYRVPNGSPSDLEKVTSSSKWVGEPN